MTMAVRNGSASPMSAPPSGMASTRETAPHDHRAGFVTPPWVALITLDRPERLNAMSHELVADLHDAFNGVAADRGTRVVVLTGAGRGFRAGLDLKGAGTPPRADGLGRIPAGIDLGIARRS